MGSLNQAPSIDTESAGPGVMRNWIDFDVNGEWNDGAAKTQLFTIFDALKPGDPIVLNGRRKLSSMIFA